MSALYGDPRLPERFWAKVRINAETGCWEWTGCGVRGYGQIWSDGKMRATHRVAYEAFVGPIPASRQIDHLCRVVGCCNPAHLEPVTAAENRRRSAGTGGVLQATCSRGHAWSDGQFRIRSRDGARVCIPCAQLRQREYLTDPAARERARAATRRWRAARKAS